MCGITGIINLTNDLVCEKNEILNFNKSLVHRGPDDNGIYINSNKKISLGHCRLNIIDLTQNGKQPMSYLNDRYWITFNGEIFNFLELKKELKFFGYKFYNNTDTEVILASYDKWGENCFNKFNGMWAIGIWDNKEKKFCLSRDRFGEKPLYYRVKKWLYSTESTKCFLTEKRTSVMVRASSVARRNRCGQAIRIGQFRR